MRKLTRLEANKEVRRVLNRKGVDLTYTQYSVAGLDIRLTGWLRKHDSSEFSINQVEEMILEFQRLLPGYFITGDFENWNFTSEHITYKGDKKTGKDEEEISLLHDQNIDFDSEAS